MKEITVRWIVIAQLHRQGKPNSTEEGLQAHGLSLIQIFSGDEVERTVSGTVMFCVPAAVPVKNEL